MHGATGTQGAPVARRLAMAGHDVRAATRHPGAAGVPIGVVPVRADLGDAASLAEAYRGADAVVVNLPGPAAPDAVAVAQADAVLAALHRASVGRVVFNASGAVWAVPVGVPFLDARTRLATRLADAVEHATVLVPATRYAENLEESWVLATMRGEGVLEQAAPPDAAVAWLALDDVAAHVERLIALEESPPALALTGAAELSGQQVLAVLSQALGRPLSWRTVSFEAYNDRVRRHLGPQYAAALAALYGAASNVPPPPPVDGPLLRGDTTLRDWALGRPWASRR